MNKITCKRLGNLYNRTGGNFAYMVYDKEGLAPTLNSMEGGGRQPMIIVEEEEYVDSRKIESK